MLSGCRHDSSPSTPPAVTDTPTVNPAPAIDAKTAFGSPEALTAFLEQRWPLNRIKEFCIPERRHNKIFQRHVASSDVIWQGTLYPITETGPDKIAWYADTEKGRATTFSLGVGDGENYWQLETGSEKSVRTPPNYLPNPNKPQFVGHK